MDQPFVRIKISQANHLPTSAAHLPLLALHLRAHLLIHLQLPHLHLSPFHFTVQEQKPVLPLLPDPQEASESLEATGAREDEKPHATEKDEDADAGAEERKEESPSSCSSEKGVQKPSSSPASSS